MLFFVLLPKLLCEVEWKLHNVRDKLKNPGVGVLSSA